MTLTNPAYVPDPDECEPVAKDGHGPAVTGPSSDSGSGSSAVTAVLGEERISSIFTGTELGPRYTLPTPTRGSKGPIPAVRVKDAIKSYGKGPQILTGLNMNIDKGTIYSLLGSSGCG